MALPASGQISLNDVNVELGNSATAQIGLGDAAVRGLFDVASGQISMSDGYGKSSETVLTSAGDVNNQPQRQQITVSDFISSGGTLRVPSTLWVWSDSRSTPALTIDVPCTIINEGKIIGKGGDGDTEPYNVGGPAIKINSGISGVTITNSSGAYIAGGGGGGGAGPGDGGGGAGGGDGGSNDQTQGNGGALNAEGQRGRDGYLNGPSRAARGYGGGAGGGGGGVPYIAPYIYPVHGGGGGRILPGAGGPGGPGGSYGNGGAGGSAGNAGSNGTGLYGGGGGGGWGAYGGDAATPPEGGAGGKAIDDSGVSYTLSNSGTIYGGT